MYKVNLKCRFEKENPSLERAYFKVFFLDVGNEVNDKVAVLGFLNNGPGICLTVALLRHYCIRKEKCECGVFEYIS